MRKMTDVQGERWAVAGIIIDLNNYRPIRAPTCRERTFPLVLAASDRHTQFPPVSNVTWAEIRSFREKRGSKRK